MFNKKNKKNSESLIAIADDEEIISEEISKDEELSSDDDKAINKKEQKRLDKEAKKKKKLEQQSMSTKLPFYQNKKIVGIILIIVAIIILVISPIINYYLGQSKVTIYVANTKIEKTLEPFSDKDKYTPIEITRGAVLPIYITDENEIINSYITEDIAEGEIISKLKVSKEITEKNSFNYILQDKKAVSIETKTLASSVSANIKAGDIVSAFIYNDTESTGYEAMLIPECEFVKVISVSNENGEKIAENTTNIIPQTVTLLLNNRQAECLIGADSQYTIYFAICSRDDRSKEKELLDKQEEMFLENEIPLIDIEEENLDV